MRLADAKAILDSLQAFADKPTLIPQLLQRIAEWAIRFSPCTASDGADGIILDATGCTHLWKGDEAYAADITKRLRQKGYSARVAIADTFGTAWAVARYGTDSLVVPQDAQAEAISALPPAALRLPITTIERLHKLGLNQVKDFITMPRPSLRRRFGKDVLLRIDQALGNEEEFFQPVYPVEPYGERLPCLEPIVTRTGIDIALEHLLQAICNRLKKEGKGLRNATFRFYRTDSTAQGIQISTSRASNNITHLFHIFSLKVDQLEPKGGIDLFILEGSKVEDVKVTQESFWKEQTGVNDVDVSELIDRIAAKVGPDTIYRYLPEEHYLPERSIRKSNTLDEKKTTEWKVDKPRPIQLLENPEKIEVTAPVPDYPPMNFRYQGKLHKIIKADGPERIEQEWWVAEGRHRDYYAVEDEEGHRYWLFRSGHYNAEKTYGWFLHGFFA